MKNIKIIMLSFAVLFAAAGCDDDDYVQYGDETFQVVTDPFLQILTPVIAFQAGIPSYQMQFNVVNGSKSITAVEVYKVFTDASTGGTSNEALLGTYPVAATGVTEVSVDLTYNDLKAGLMVNGNNLPDNEVDLAIGSGWVFRFVGVRAGGNLDLPGNIRVGVLSRFAGLYRVIHSEYFRIGVPTATWDGQTRFIGSVDATTFSYNDFWGNFAWGGNSFNFRLNEADNTIQVPLDSGSGIFSGSFALDCSINPQYFTNVPCDGSNILIPDDANGKHEIRLTYGYFNNADGGAREFYEILEKI